MTAQRATEAPTTAPTIGYGAADPVITRIGATVGEARAQEKIPDSSRATINHVPVAEDRVLLAGEHLEFETPAPELG